MTGPRFDILGLSVVAVDDIVHVASYPGADEKQPVSREERVLGGLGGTALAAAAPMPTPCRKGSRSRSASPSPRRPPPYSPRARRAGPTCPRPVT